MNAIQNYFDIGTIEVFLITPQIPKYYTSRKCHSFNHYEIRVKSVNFHEYFMSFK